MDPRHFDTFSRALVAMTSRREALRLLTGFVLIASGWHADDDATAHDPSKSCRKKSGKQKKKCLKKAKKHNAAHASETSTLPGPPCSDGVKNGNETSVDCGGSCKRCATSQACASRNDCATAVCSGGTCTACGSRDAACGTNCACDYEGDSATTVCMIIGSTGDPVDDCGVCSSDEVCIPAGTTDYQCAKRCGTA